MNALQGRLLFDVICIFCFIAGMISQAIISKLSDNFKKHKKAQVTTPTALFILFIGLLLVAYIMALPPELRRVLLG